MVLRGSNMWVPLHTGARESAFNYLLWRVIAAFGIGYRAFKQQSLPVASQEIDRRLGAVIV
jgi:hypothetical protein